MAKKKKLGPMGVMNSWDIAYRKRLLKRWGNACIVCGREFMNLACVTKEHVIPKSAPSELKLDENIAPSHHRCNQLRRTDSLLKTARQIDAIEMTMSPNEFVAWLNEAVPHRLVPFEAVLPLKYLHRNCFELPEILPGMRYAG